MIVNPVSTASLASSAFQARTRFPFESPPSAVSVVAVGKRVRPSVFHHRRIDSTANSAVSAVSPTDTQPSSLPMSYTPYGIALEWSPRLRSAKSWVDTLVGSPFGSPFRREPPLRV